MEIDYFYNLHQQFTVIILNETESKLHEAYFCRLHTVVFEGQLGIKLVFEQS